MDEYVRRPAHDADELHDRGRSFSGERHGGDLPLDSDLEVAETEQGLPRPVHLRWQYLALVALGGTVGTALRELLTLTLPAAGQFPVVTFGINAVGALLLGALLESLTRRGPDEGRRRALRLLVGTGVLGGFTTYSALATDTGLLLAGDHLSTALLYALGTLIVGSLASWAGIAGVALIHRRRSAVRLPEDGDGE